MKVMTQMSLGTTYEPELLSWQKKLEHLQLENVQLKIRVADVIKNDVNNISLEHMESFLNRLIDKDAVFAFLRSDLAEQLKAIRGEIRPDNKLTIDKRQMKLRQDVCRMEQEFGKVARDFDSYVIGFGVS